MEVLLAERKPEGLLRAAKDHGALLDERGFVNVPTALGCAGHALGCPCHARCLLLLRH